MTGRAGSTTGPGISSFATSDARRPRRPIKETSEEERLALLDEFGFGAVRAFPDVATDLDANEMACELYREQVRRIVRDPETAAGLLPRGHPVGCKRQVIDTDY